MASAVAAVAIAVAVSRRDHGGPGPDDVLRDLLQAAKAGDTELVYELLGPRTREQLDRETKRATDFVGAAVRYVPSDLISLRWSETIPAPTEMVVLDESGDHARVLVVSEGGGRAIVDTYRIDGAWRVELLEYRSIAPAKSAP